MIPNHHRAKNVFGELTFGEYWNLVGCHAAAARLNGSRMLVTRFEPDGESVKFLFHDPDDCSETYFSVSLKCKVQVAGNKVKMIHDLDKNTTIEFFELKPLEFDVSYGSSGGSATKFDE